MRTLTITLVTLAVGVGLAACGSSGGTTNSTSTPSASGSSSSQSAGKSTHSGAAAQKLSTQAQKIVRQLATATGALTSGNSRQAQQARQDLQKVHGEATQLEQAARQQLAASSPARIAITQTAKRVSATANKLQHMSLSASTQQNLRNVRGTLNKLATAVGNVGGQLHQGSATAIGQVAQNLSRLSSELQSTAVGATS